MKNFNLHDVHSVYLKNHVRGSENWERIEGVHDAQARINQPSSYSLQKKRILQNALGKEGLPGAVRKIVRLFK
ncbi:hypothetical protein [Silvanigrella aquatica]|uniref:Uncharacterized protein n=1 Tax=Silvanigrella aquatica TaxID=1915309 RepID=A0A1L4CYC5_9BACT|nr:hypothetical protein [Silvanigrella aquatica]APJ02952.1 hypothetical protein AXG55_03090 [Silvanigrella aquatica]